MRTLKLTHAEVELLTTVLKNEYNRRLKIMEVNSDIFTDDMRNEFFKKTNAIDDLAYRIEDGSRDVY